MSEDGSAQASTSKSLESPTTEAKEPVVIPFKPATDDAREVDPAELTGKTIKAVYPIYATDGSKYRVRIDATNEEGEVEYTGNIKDEDDLEGKTITAASLLRCTGEEVDARLPDLDIRRSEIQYAALGFKVDGSEEWNLLYGSEDSEYGSDSGYATYYDVFIICMNRPGGARARGRGRGRGRR